RRMIHDRAASALESLYAQQLEKHYTELAHHCVHGNDAAKACRYAQLAAEQAVGRAAYPEAVSLLEAALKLLDKLPDAAERLRAELGLRGIESGMDFVLFGGSSREREGAIRRMCELAEKMAEGDVWL